MRRAQQNGNQNPGILRKMRKLLKQKDDVVKLILLEMKEDNGSVRAIKADESLRDYDNARLIGYVKLFGRFGSKKKSINQVDNKSEKNQDESKKSNIRSVSFEW